MTENAKAIEHLQTLVGLFSLDDHNKRIDALSWLIDDRARMHAELERLRVELDTIENARVAAWSVVHAEQAKLAAANALLVRWTQAPEISQHVYLSGEADMSLGHDTHAHLAGQVKP
jgi:hypothetical protein